VTGGSLEYTVSVWVSERMNRRQDDGNGRAVLDPRQLGPEAG